MHLNVHRRTIYNRQINKIQCVCVCVYSGMSFSGGASGKEPICQCSRHKRHGFNPWVGKTPWRKAQQPTPVFLPREFHGQRSLASCSPGSRKMSDMTEVTQHTCMHIVEYFSAIKKKIKFCHLQQCGWTQRML